MNAGPVVGAADGAPAEADSLAAAYDSRPSRRQGGRTDRRRRGACTWLHPWACARRPARCRWCSPPACPTACTLRSASSRSMRCPTPSRLGCVRTPPGARATPGRRLRPHHRSGDPLPEGPAGGADHGAHVSGRAAAGAADPVLVWLCIVIDSSAVTFWFRRISARGVAARQHEDRDGGVGHGPGRLGQEPNRCVRHFPAQPSHGCRRSARRSPVPSAAASVRCWRRRGGCRIVLGAADQSTSHHCSGCRNRRISHVRPPSRSARTTRRRWSATRHSTRAHAFGTTP